MGGGNPDGSSELFLYETATATTAQVTFTTCCALNFVNGISADGTRIVFRSRGNFTGGNIDGNVEIFMYDTTTNMFTQVTNINGGSASNFASAHPDISADGSTIVFQSLNDHVSENGDGNVEIFSYDVASDTITQITHTAGVNNIEPSVNTDGTRIVFGSNSNITGQNGSGYNQVFLYDVPSNMFTQVSMANNVGGAQFPDIDASGGRIVFQLRHGSPRRNEIVVADCVAGGDSDGDGIPDDEDDCVDSDTSETVLIDGCDSGVANFIDGDGCSISDLIAEIVAGSLNHGIFTSEVSHLLNELKAAGIISGSDKGVIQSCAGGADIP